MPSPPKSIYPGLNDHRNDVSLIGELAAPPQARTLPSGDEVLAFRLTVRSAPDRGRASVKATSAGPTAQHSDSLECAVWRPALQTRLQRCVVGDVLEISGALRHRYWRGPGGLASRYEIETNRIRVVARASSGAKVKATSAKLTSAKLTSAKTTSAKKEVDRDQSEGPS